MPPSRAAAVSSIKPKTRAPRRSDRLIVHAFAPSRPELCVGDFCRSTAPTVPRAHKASSRDGIVLAWSTIHAEAAGATDRETHILILKLPDFDSPVNMWLDAPALALCNYDHEKVGWCVLEHLTRLGGESTSEVVGLVIQGLELGNQMSSEVDGERSTLELAYREGDQAESSSKDSRSLHRGILGRDVPCWRRRVKRKSFREKYTARARSAGAGSTRTPFREAVLSQAKQGVACHDVPRTNRPLHGALISLFSRAVGYAATLIHSPVRLS